MKRKRFRIGKVNAGIEAAAIANERFNMGFTCAGKLAREIGPLRNFESVIGGGRELSDFSLGGR